MTCIQDKFSKQGARLVTLDNVSFQAVNQNKDIDRAVSLIKALGNSVFISESPQQADRLAAQTLIQFSADEPSNQAVQLNIRRLLEAGKDQAGSNFQSIIQHLREAEGRVGLIIANLEEIVEDKHLVSVFLAALGEKSVPIIGLTDIQGFRKLEGQPGLSGFLQFILVQKDGIKSKRDKSVLIIGASSLFGNALYDLFSREYKVVTGTGFSKAAYFGFDKLDVTSEDEVKKYFTRHPGFDIVAYIAGETDADVVEKERDRARILNIDALARLSRFAKNCKFVYTSTEYVFDGSSGPYGSNSGARPINYYGQTKLEGEKVALKNFPNALVVRLGALYGYNGPNDKKTTVSKLIASLDKPEPLEVDNVQIKHPLLLEDAVSSLLKLLDYGLTGIYQVNGPEGLKKNEMVEQIVAARTEIAGRTFSYPIVGVEQTGIAGKPFNTHMVNVDTPRLFKEGIRFLIQKQAAFKKIQSAVSSLTAEEIGFVTKLPIKFVKGNFADYMWGGYHLYDMKGLAYDRDTMIAAESWEASGHSKYPSRIQMPDGRIVVFMDLLKDRQLAGLILGEAVVEHFGQDFPLLTKFVDVHKHMSAHLHPSHKTAKALGEKDPGKEEVFIVIDVHEGAESALYLGLKEGVTREAFEAAVSKEENILDLSHKIYVKPGDIYRIPSGVLHCWTGGSIAVEITESSDLTYRLYDFRRHRPTHIKKGLASIDFKCKQGLELEKECRGHWVPISSKGIYFVPTHNFLKVERLSAGIEDNPVEICNRDIFEVLMGIDGEMEIVSSSNDWHVHLNKGRSLLIPAKAGDYFARGVGKSNKNHVLRISMKIPGREDN